MATPETGKLLKLSDTERSVARSDDDIRGRTVRDRDGDELGKIDDLLVDEQEDKVRFMVVASGGFLGLGETKSFIPIDAITRITEDDVHIDKARSHVAGAPAYDPDLVTERDDYADVYGYYGYQPYWLPGYTYPTYRY